MILIHQLLLSAAMLMFYSKLYVGINNNHPENIDDIMKLCVKEGAFKEFNEAIKHFIPVVITTFYTLLLMNAMLGIMMRFI